MKVQSYFCYSQEKEKLKQIILNEIIMMHSKVLESYKLKRKNNYLQTLKDTSNNQAPTNKQIFKIEKTSLCCSQFNQKIMNHYQESQKNLDQQTKIKLKILKNQSKNQSQQHQANERIPKQIIYCSKYKDQAKVIFKNFKVTQSIQFSQIQKKAVHSIQSNEEMESSIEPVTKSMRQGSDDRLQMASESQITGIMSAINKDDQSKQQNKSEVNQIQQFRLSESVYKTKPTGEAKLAFNLPKSSPGQKQQDEELFLN